jgi:hypothetical protein
MRLLCSWPLLVSLTLGCASNASDPQGAAAGSDGGATGDAGGAASTGAPQASPPFTAFCAGRLLTSQKLMNPGSASGWDSTNDSAPAGTVFLVGLNVANRFTGYVVAGAKPRKLAEPSLSTGLALGVDFESTCVTAPTSATKAFVVLAPSTFFADRALTGTACNVEAGAELGSYSFSGGPTSTVTSTDLRTRCGFSPGYTKDLVYGFVAKK